MQTYDSAFTARSDPDRDQWGRRKLDLDGSGKTVGVTAVTTLANTLKDTHGLEVWKLRQLAIGLSQRQDLIQICRTSAEDKGALDKAVTTALTVAGTDAKANTGTAFHRAVQAAVGGAGPESIPEEFHPALTMLFDELRRLEITLLPQYSERLCACRALATNGIVDYLATVAGLPQLVVVDLKTGSVDYDAQPIRIQLASYARSDVLFDVDGKPGPMPPLNQSVGLVIAVRLGEHPTVDIRAADLVHGWHDAVLAATVRSSRRTSGELLPYVPTRLPVPGATPLPASEPIPAVVPFEQPAAGRHAVPEQEQAPVPIEQQSAATKFLSDAPPESPSAARENPIGQPATEDDRAAALYELLKKKKDKAQSLAREVMTGGPPIKLAQYGVNVCRDILQHPNWPKFEARYFPVQSAGGFEQPTGHTIGAHTEVTGQELPGAGHMRGDEPDALSPQAQQIQQNVASIQNGTDPRLASVTPIRQPTPEEVEQALIRAIGELPIGPRSDGTWPEMSAIWSASQEPGGPGWTGQLNTVSRARARQLATPQA